MKSVNVYVTYFNKIINLFNVELLYARVDGIMVDNKFKLMELELIEPSLSLKSDKFAPIYLRDAILDKLSLMYLTKKDSYYVKSSKNSPNLYKRVSKKKSSKLKRRKKRSVRRQSRR